MKRKQWPNDWVKKNMDMDMHSKPAAQERAIPENDKMENEKLENMEKRAKISRWNYKPVRSALGGW